MSVVKVAIANSHALRLVMCRRICAPPELSIRIFNPLKNTACLSEKRKEKSEKSNSLVAISLWVRIHKAYDFFRCAQGATPSSPQ